jgi:hypothetical protein
VCRRPRVRATVRLLRGRGALGGLSSGGRVSTGDLAAATGLTMAGSSQRRFGGKLRRIEQEGVLAHQTTGCPVEFEQQIDKGIVDRPGGRQPDDRLAIGSLVNGQRDARTGRGSTRHPPA